MDIYGSDGRNKGKARERIEARKRRRAPMVRPLDPSAPPRTMVTPDSAAETQPASCAAATQRTPRVTHDNIPASSNREADTTPAQFRARQAAQTMSRAARRAARHVEQVDWRRVGRSGRKAVLIARDSLWYARSNPRILFALVGGIAAVFALWVLIYVTGSRIFPGVSTMGLSLGGLTAEEAVERLQDYWNRELVLTLRDGERMWQVNPVEFGLRLNARETVEAMRAVGLSGVPLGYTVKPTVEMDILQTQNVLLEISEQAQIQPLNGGYRWENDVLIGVPGTDGRFLDVSSTLDALQDELTDVVSSRDFDLIMTTVLPDVVDPEPFMDDVRALVADTFVLNGYDPFTNERWAWATDRTTFLSWLEAGYDTLTLRESAFAPFVAEQTTILQRSNPLRYLEPTETIGLVREAIQARSNEVYLRVRYQPDTYEFQSGDTGYFVARKTGIPFTLIQEANPGRDWEDMISPGEVINLPSRDMTLPSEIRPEKRIVVNIDTQYLVAYENGNVVFDWLISTGMSSAPTYPGVYQILSHVELATGSSFELCSADTCGTWDMYWFMGIYEVFPGLVNGFHGAVVLPNGSYLGGGNVGRPFTYGCVMSEDGNAELLYNWAEEGTIVEIISSDYDPQSDLGWHVRNGTYTSLPRILPGSTTVSPNDDVLGSPAPAEPEESVGSPA